MKPHYFVSDLHLGAQGDSERRLRFSHFLSRIKSSAAGLYILGDLFEFGFEYRHRIVARNIPIAAELAGLVKAGVQVVLVRGNHDYWLGARFEQTYDIRVVDSPSEITIEGRRVLLAHGDELDRAWRTRLTRRLFKSRVATWFYSLLPEALGVSLAGSVAGVSRRSELNPVLIAALEDFAACRINEGFDIVAIGHVHSPALKAVGKGWYLNPGDWLTHYTYGVLDEQGLRLEKFEP